MSERFQSEKHPASSCTVESILFHDLIKEKEQRVLFLRAVSRDIPDLHADLYCIRNLHGVKLYPMVLEEALSNAVR